MDQKQRKQKNKLLNHLSSAASAVNFQAHNQPFSPGRDHQRRYGEGHSHSKLRGFSGLMAPVIPEEVMRRRNGRGDAADEEPTSPKISCIGQIKHKKEMKRRAHAAAKAQKAEDDLRRKQERAMSTKKGSYSFKNFFKRSSSDVSGSASGNLPHEIVATENTRQSLSQMKRFASGRNGLRDFDWRSHRRPMESQLAGSDSDGEEEPIIPLSAPMSIGCGGNGGGIDLKPRDEVNLWKRRPMTRPAPLILR